MDSHWCLKKNAGKEGHTFELVGRRMVCICHVSVFPLCDFCLIIVVSVGIFRSTYLKVAYPYTQSMSILDLSSLEQIKIFRGRKLDYEPKHCEKQRTEEDFMTAAEFSAADPYGKAIALLDLKSGVVKVYNAAICQFYQRGTHRLQHFSFFISI